MNDRQLIADLLSALEYHTEQTRPIEFSRVAIEAAREHLRKLDAPSRQRLHERKQLRTVTYVCPVCAASLEGQE